VYTLATDVMFYLTCSDPPVTCECAEEAVAFTACVKVIAFAVKRITSEYENTLW